MLVGQCSSLPRSGFVCPFFTAFYFIMLLCVCHYFLLSCSLTIRMQVLLYFNEFAPFLDRPTAISLTSLVHRWCCREAFVCLDNNLCLSHL